MALSSRVSFVGNRLGARESVMAGGKVMTKRDSVLVPEDAEKKFHIPRGTHSAARAAEKEGGLAPILTRFPLNLQRAIREVCIDFLMIQSKLLTLETRHRGEAPPEVLLETREVMKQCKIHLKELAGAESPHLIKYLISDEARSGFVLTEDYAESEVEARIARRKLTKNISYGSNRPLTTTVHDAKTGKGVDSVWNQAQVDNRTYYERQQAKYGKGRKGSTSHSGSVWDEVFEDDDDEDDGTNPDSDPLKAARAAAAAHEASVAAAAAASSARPAYGAPPPPSPGAGAGAGGYVMPTEAFLPGDPGYGSPVSPRAAPGRSASASASSGGSGGRALPTTPSAMPAGSDPRSRLSKSRSGRGSVLMSPGHGGTLYGGGLDTASVASRTFERSSEVVKATETAQSFTILRGTHTAARAAEKVGGVALTLAHYPLAKQRAIREVCLDVLELEVRLKTIKDRWLISKAPGDKPPSVLKATEDELKTTTSKLYEMVGREDAHELLAVLRSDEVMTAAVATEDDVGTEEEARVMRRRLLKFFHKGFNSGHTMTTHDVTDTHGQSSAWNVKAEDTKSYYQRQQEKYGRARRGSGSFAGASVWDEVLSDGAAGGDDAGAAMARDAAAAAAAAYAPPATAAAGAPRTAAAPAPPATAGFTPEMLEAMREAQSGNAERLMALAMSMSGGGAAAASAAAAPAAAPAASGAGGYSMAPPTWAPEAEASHLPPPPAGDW